MSDEATDSSHAGTLYLKGARSLQDQFDARRLADRLQEITVTGALDERQQGFISQATYFFLGTTDADGFPDLSHKGGPAGFVQIVDDHTLRFPSYDGNGMYRSLGNIIDTAKVALLFIRQDDRPVRIRLHGTAHVITDPAIVAGFAGAEAVVEVHMGRAFPNCPRYVHNLATGDESESTPREGYEPPQPEWKQWDAFRNLLPGT